LLVVNKQKSFTIPTCYANFNLILVYIHQKSEKLETKDNFDRVRENLNKAESENRAEEGIDVKQLTDLEMPKSETEGKHLQKFCRCQSVYLSKENKNKHMILPETKII